MTYQHQRFHTNGSNALKVEDLEFDVFVKPQFLAERDRASIIDFDDACKEHDLAQKASSRARLSVRPANSSLAPRNQRNNRLIDKIRSNRILGDLFVPKQKNAYRRDDLVTFAKGFSATGAATFIMILFGV